MNDSTRTTDGTTHALAYRPPFRFAELLSFFRSRAIAGVERIDESSYARCVRLHLEDGEETCGWLRVEDDPAQGALVLSMSTSLRNVAPLVAAHVRRMFDLDCEPDAVHEGLAPLESIHPGANVAGTRLPGCFDPFETCCRAVLGQQVSVAAANKLAARVAEVLGARLETGIEGLERTWPVPADILALDAPSDVLGPLGVIGSRTRAMCEIARMMEAGELRFDTSADALEQMAALQSIKGIGPWTANYVAMRVLSYPDAFLETDAGVAHALPELSPKERLAAVEPCRPWRSYAVVGLWNSLAAPEAPASGEKASSQGKKAAASGKRANKTANAGARKPASPEKRADTSTKTHVSSNTVKKKKAAAPKKKATPAKQRAARLRSAARKEHRTMTVYRTEYESELIGPLTIASDGASIVGCWFGNDRYFGYGVDEPMEQGDDLPLLVQARDWFDRYFAGDAPDPRELPLGARATPFQALVREAMLDIPYGQTGTYGSIAKRLEKETGRRQSARAVGGAVGHNPLCVIVPCHRVVGTSGSLTGFGGGIDMKVKLLEHEGIDLSAFTIPTRGTAIDPATWLTH